MVLASGLRPPSGGPSASLQPPTKLPQHWSISTHQSSRSSELSSTHQSSLSSSWASAAPPGSSAAAGAAAAHRAPQQQLSISSTHQSSSAAAGAAAAPTRVSSAAAGAANSALSTAPSVAPTMVLSAAPTRAVDVTSPKAPEPAAPNPLLAVSRYTQRNRRRRAEEEASGSCKRKYVRDVAFNTCSKCGQPKTKEFGHSRYQKAFFCARSSGGVTIEQWLSEQRLKDKPEKPPT
ncbi:hypothetical protein WMY93_032873 [Mugilogobius chulae]|uniref:Uncharacterized protein n=1 Tax=Mugilogobius chulae TaxID=88201 RepID=A0AAW0MPL6_9GOBI